MDSRIWCLRTGFTGHTAWSQSHAHGPILVLTYSKKSGPSKKVLTPRTCMKSWPLIREWPALIVSSSKIWDQYVDHVFSTIPLSPLEDQTAVRLGPLMKGPDLASPQFPFSRDQLDRKSRCIFHVNDKDKVKIFLKEMEWAHLRIRISQGLGIEEV